MNIVCVSCVLRRLGVEVGQVWVETDLLVGVGPMGAAGQGGQPLQGLEHSREGKVSCLWSQQAQFSSSVP